MSRSNFKRRLVGKDEFLLDMGENVNLFFIAFSEALDKYNHEITQTPPQSRGRNLEASLFNAKMQCAIQNCFPDCWKNGKHKRFILKFDKYLFLLKKLDKKGLPMNVKTKHTDSINSQLTNSLFHDADYVEDPIIYFGYERDKVGNFTCPRFIYIDDNQIKWIAYESRNETNQLFSNVEQSTTETKPVTAKLRNQLKKAK